jgi:hypothetical protein
MKNKQTYENLSKNRKQFNAVVGLDLESFDCLGLYFKDELEKHSALFTVSGKSRLRAVSVRKDRYFESSNDCLCFILSYLKNNSLQQTLASNWGMLQPRANVWIHYFLPILHKTLDELRLIPASNSEKLMGLVSKVDTIFLDGTERSIQRPLHKEEQKRHYSGKKNTYGET